MSCDAILVGDGPVRHLTQEESEAYCGPGFVWIHVESADAAELAALRADSEIPDVAASALVATETRPRCDAFDHGALVNLRGLAGRETDGDRLVSIRMWVRKGKLHSVTRRPLLATQTVVAQMEAGAIHDPGDLVAAFARAISKELDPEIADLGDTLDDCETELAPRNVYKLRTSIARIRSEAIALRRFVSPDRDALTTLSHLDFEWLAEEDRLHIREAADRFARMTEELEAVRERAALLHEQLTDMRAEQLEARTLLVSIVALIFLPLTFITGLLGMNVEGIPYAGEPWAFWAITGLCVALALAIAFYFISIQWLRR
ncbi:MAG TPA: zinc transporter ZntB [Allosphingosinicella sp.]|nr:zinc transporter ZntB [Allosphingosinicella sp.]